MRSRIAAPGLPSHLQSPVPWAPYTDFCKVPGPSGWWNRYGHLLPSAAGGFPPNGTVAPDTPRRAAGPADRPGAFRALLASLLDWQRYLAPKNSHVIQPRIQFASRLPVLNNLDRLGRDRGASLHRP